MELQKINFKIRCDIDGCGHLASHALRLSNAPSGERVFVCESCLAEIREALKIKEQKL